MFIFILQEHADKLKSKIKYFSASRGKSGEEKSEPKIDQGGSLFKAHLSLTCILKSGKSFSEVSQIPFCDKGKHEIKVNTI